MPNKISTTIIGSLMAIGMLASSGDKVAMNPMAKSAGKCDSINPVCSSVRLFVE